MGQSRLFSETDMAQAGPTSTLFARLTDTLPLPKRAKGGGLNTRFDRMVQTMNVTHRSPTRTRTRSIGSSSVSSYDMPKTPLDAYDALQQGRLGRDFSVIKMNSGQSIDEDDEVQSSPAAAKRPPPPLPNWLADTFSTLHDAHPLRLLMPDSSRKLPLAHVPDITQEPVDNENPFAYDIHRREDHSRPSSHKSAHSQTVYASPKIDVSGSPSFIPFTTPGPASTVSTHAAMKRPLPQLLPTALSLTLEHPSSLINSRRDLPLDSSLLPSLPPREDQLSSIRRSAPSIVSPATFHVPKPMLASPYHNTSSPQVRSAPIFPRHIALPKPTHPSWLQSPDNVLPFPSHRRPSSPSEMLPPSSDIPIADYSDDVLFNMPDEQAYMKDDEAELVLPNIYATPGPGYFASRPVYFDSPAEHPDSSSSPVPFEDWTTNLDPTELDFQWKPFIRSAPPPTVVNLLTDAFKPHTPSSDAIPHEMEADDDTFNMPSPRLADNPAWNDLRSPLPSPAGRFRYAPPPEERTFLSREYSSALPKTAPDVSSPGPLLKQRTPSTRKLAPPPPPHFAPAPGIFISPLRGSPGEDDEQADSNASPMVRDGVDVQVRQELTEGGDTAKKRMDSQSSTDTIESWTC